VFLGLWSGLDQLVEGIRSLDPMGVPQRVNPSREPVRATRLTRICFVASGAGVILLGLYAAIFGR
jgi:hypothetical protein